MAREREIKNDFKIAFSLHFLAIPYIIEVFLKPIRCQILVKTCQVFEFRQRDFKRDPQRD